MISERIEDELMAGVEWNGSLKIDEKPFYILCEKKVVETKPNQ